MKQLYRRLSQIGYTRKFLREVALPDWWDDQAAENPTAYAQALLILARHLGLDLASLQDESAAPLARAFGQCKFKKRADATGEDLAYIRAMAAQVAQLLAAACPVDFQGVPDAAEVRQSILDRGASWVGFTEVVDYCWSVGIPVVHLWESPRGRRPDGLAVSVGGRPVILLCKRSKSPAWLLFILAHELGHVALRHVTGDSVLIDDQVHEDADDPEERDANAYAIELLTGGSRTQFMPTGRWPNADGLAAEAVRIGGVRGIHPGHIVLNYAHSMGASFFPVANQALKLLEPAPDAIGQTRAKMAAELDWSALPTDTAEFLARVTLGE